nr:acyltransferase [Cellulosimicrobium arenosum]
MRGLAAFAVFACHIGGYWALGDPPKMLLNLLSNGTHGVDVFIVISGFCLGLPVLAAHRLLATRTFYGRRAWRILPPYYVALAIATALAVLPATWPLVVSRPADGTDIAVHAIGMQTWFPPTLGTINGSLWSVSLEIQLYLVFPLLVLVWRRWGNVALLGVALVLSVGWEVAGRLGDTPYLGDSHALPACLIQFVAGMVTADVVRRGRGPSTPVALSSLVVLLAGGVLVYTIGLSVPVQKVTWGAVGVAAVLVVSGPTGQVLGRTALEWFGARSFSFYLLHQPVLLLCGALVALVPGGWVVRFFVCGALCFALVTALAAIMYRFVEMPAHRQGRTRFPSRRSGVAPDGSVSAVSS